MNRYNRFTEPENYIESSGSLNLKWAAVIAVIGIALLIFLSGCQWKHDNEYVMDSEGNIYRLEASGIRHESYDLKPIDKEKVKQILGDTIK